MTVIPALGEYRQKIQEFNAILSYKWGRFQTSRPFLKITAVKMIGRYANNHLNLKHK